MAPDIDPVAMKKAKDDGKKLADVAKEIPGASVGKPEDVLTMDADILIPAALGRCHHEEVAGKVKAKTILELANGPVTADADAVLEGRGIDVIPDVPRERGRRDRVLFRMGAEHAGDDDDPRAGERAPERRHGTGLDRHIAFRERAWRLVPKSRFRARCRAYPGRQAGPEAGLTVVVRDVTIRG